MRLKLEERVRTSRAPYEDERAGGAGRELEEVERWRFIVSLACGLVSRVGGCVWWLWVDVGGCVCMYDDGG